MGKPSRIPKSDKARLRRAEELLRRFCNWHRNVPDDPTWQAGTMGRLVQQTRLFLGSAASAAPKGGE